MLGKSINFIGDKPNAWTLLKDDVEGKSPSTKISQGFVGVLFGLYAYSAGN